eukprot:12592956-Ditylum_brightwellii.AAC.1
MEWYQWEVNIQLLAKDAMQLNLTNGIDSKVKVLMIAKNVKDLLDYSVIDGRNTKEAIARIGHLTKINPVRIYQANYQEQLNEALDIVAAEVEEEHRTYFTNCGTIEDKMIINIRWRVDGTPCAKLKTQEE